MRTLCCSFCQKAQREVRKLIAGPSTYICDECVVLCVEILHQDGIAVHFMRVAPEGLELPLDGFIGQLSPTAKVGDLLALLAKQDVQIPLRAKLMIVREEIRRGRELIEGAEAREASLLAEIAALPSIRDNSG